MRWIKATFIIFFLITNNLNPNSPPEEHIYIPLVKTSSTAPQTQTQNRVVNVPYFNSTDLISKIPEMAILWFGKVSPDVNYTDVRMGYNDTELEIHVQIFDRRNWYNSNPASSPFENWDSLAMTLNLDKDPTTLSQKSYRFLGQLFTYESSASYKKAYQGNGSSWAEKSIAFSTTPGWRGDPDDDIDDRGWAIDFHIPFSSLGLSSVPTAGTLFHLGFSLYDRDSAAGPALTAKTWPEDFNDKLPSTWGGLRFGLVNYTTPSVSNVQTTTIRQGVNGNYVPDSAVGGGSLCGSGLDYWSEWGNTNYKGETFFNVQNQVDVADWPCFSKDYVTFPLTNIPPGKVIKSARLSMHQFGGSDPTQAQPSLIQVLSVKDNWNETTLTWNNAPYAFENIAQTWVNVIQSNVPWPGVEYNWNVSYAVDTAYRSNQPLRLVLYSADTAYHSGKYFTTSEAEDWDIAGRPTLFIDWGDAN